MVIIKHCLYSLCCTIYPCHLFILYIVVCTSKAPTPSCPSLLPLPTDKHWFVLCICESVSFLLHSLVFLFQIPCISDIIQYLSFSICLISLSIIPSESIHIVPCQYFYWYCLTKKLLYKSIFSLSIERLEGIPW